MHTNLGWGYRGSRGSRGGRYQSGGRQQSSSRGGSSQTKSVSASASKKPIKFDGDFDFESSNAKFKKDQMEEEFKQMKLVDGRKESDSGLCIVCCQIGYRDDQDTCP